MNPELLCGIVLCLVYLFLVLSRRHHATAVWVGVAALVVVPVLLGKQSILVPSDLFRLDASGSWAAVNWNVIGIFTGTLLVAEAFIFSRVPAVLADWLISKMPNVGWAILAVCAMSGFISMFAENVATVLIVAPIALEIGKKLDVSPAPFLIGIAICSNLEGTATLIGDPPSMLLAAQFKMNFLDFFVHGEKMGIFWAVQIGALAGFMVLWILFRKYRQPVGRRPVGKVYGWFPTILMVYMVFSLILASYVDPAFRWFGGAVCVSCGLAALLWLYRQDRRTAAQVVRSFDWSTTFFLMGVFMLVYALKKVGAVDDLAKLVCQLTGRSIVGAFLLVVVCSLAISAFVDNVPYLAAMLPMMVAMTADLGLGNNMVLAYGLLIGSCLGGNITPVGASANMVAYGMLRRLGEAPGFYGFAKIGLPFTLAATAAASLVVWLAWMVCG